MKTLCFSLFLFVSQISFAQDFNKLEGNKGFIVTVFFTIDTLGGITEVKAKPSPDIDERFLHDTERIVMSMAPFEPELKNGIPVMGRRRLDVKFKSEPEN
jgi:hypothetical protein